MGLLTMEMFGANKKRNVFGLKTGQIRSGPSKVIHAGGWYNAIGEMLGHGDLWVPDLAAVAKGLPVEELFLVLPDADAAWTPGEESRDALRHEKRLSTDDVAERCILLVSKGRVHMVGEFDKLFTYGEMVITSMPRGEATELIRGAAYALSHALLVEKKREEQAALDYWKEFI